VPPPDPIRRIVEVIVPRAVDSIDVNEVVGEIDLDQVLERIDLNALLARIDIDALVERIDVDAVLQRVDIEKLIERIDLADIIKRVQVDAIVTATASGLGNRLLDLVRRQLVGVDILITRLMDRILGRQADVTVSADRSFTGQLAGGATRMAGFLIDVLIVFLVYTGLVALVFFVASLFVGHNIRPTDHKGLAQIIAFAILALLYQWVSLVIAGRTIGRAMAGLRVTAPDGSPIGVAAATRRVLVYPFSFVLGLGLIGIVVGRRHRAMHDVAAPSLVRYDWGDRPAEMPTPIGHFLERRGVQVGPEVPQDGAPVHVLARASGEGEAPKERSEPMTSVPTGDGTRGGVGETGP
jgi:uncharacterized RDD family membrane protein YckC